METILGPDVIREEALVMMVEKYQGMLLRMCFLQLKDAEMAKDAVQETFLKAYKAFSSCYYIFAPCSWQSATGEGHLVA